jgi:hypothetical protein
VTRVLVAAFVLVTVVSAAPAAPAAPTIQPGTFISTPVGGCTLSFVFDGDGRTFLATAAHCVRGVGDAVTTQDGTVIGRAAVVGSAASASTDWALIQIASAYVSRVHADVLGHVGTPTGVATSSRVGDEVLYSGYGIPWDQTQYTREHRFGFMETQTRSTYRLIGSDTWGDSGGPIILAKNGRAMGIVSRFCFGPCTSEGPTVQAVLQQAAAKGVPVTLRTAAP